MSPSRWSALAARPVRANGQVAFGTYYWDDDRRAYVAGALDLVEFRDDRVSDIVAFLDGGLFERFGLPAQL